MLQLSSYLLGRPVLSLRSGTTVARTTKAIINPNTLKFEGLYCTDTRSNRQNLVLVTADIRELAPQGLIIDDYDVLSMPGELVRLQPILTIDFVIQGKTVETVSHTKVGTVDDYAVDTSSMFIQKLYVSEPFWKNPMGGSLSIDRMQIIEITDKRIIIQEILRGEPSVAAVPA